MAPPLGVPPVPVVATLLVKVQSVNEADEGLSSPKPALLLTAPPMPKYEPHGVVAGADGLVAPEGAAGHLECRTAEVVDGPAGAAAEEVEAGASHGRFPSNVLAAMGGIALVQQPAAEDIVPRRGDRLVGRIPSTWLSVIECARLVQEAAASLAAL